MSFAFPSAFLWALLAIPIVVFYILKIRLKRVPVSTVLFWRQIFDEKKPQSIWQRLRHLLSLLAQLFLLALLVLSLAEPFFSSESKTARRIILVVDNSASMNARDLDTTRLAKAKEEAHSVIRSLRYLDEMAIVSAGTQPRVACGITGHQKTLREALESITPTDGPTQLVDAIALGKRLAADKNGGEKEARVVVITDGGVPDFAKLTDDPVVKFIVLGKKTSNVAITRLQVRRSTIDPIGYETLLEVVNQSDEESGPIRLVVNLNDNVVDVKPLNLKPGEKWSQVLENTTADGGALTAELVVKGEKGDEPLQDGLASDNKASAVLPKRETQPVHMHSPNGNLFLQRVLEANPLTDLATSKTLPETFKPGTVHVFHRETPAKLPAGQVLVVDPANDCDLWKVGDKLPTAIVTQQDKDSPIMAHVRLDNVIMPEARKLTFTPQAGKPQILAGAVSGDPLFALIERPEGKVVVLTVNLDLGDLPFRTAFPILAMNTLSFFTSGQGELRESLATGATAEVTLSPLPTGATEYLLKSPDKSTRKLPLTEGKLTVGPFDQVGVWSVVTNAPDAKPVEEFAVNLMNPVESDLRVAEGLPVSDSAQSAGLVGGFFGRPIWYYLIALAWLLMALEWYLYQRRWLS